MKKSYALACIWLAVSTIKAMLMSYCYPTVEIPSVVIAFMLGAITLFHLNWAADDISRGR